MFAPSRASAKAPPDASKENYTNHVHSTCSVACMFSEDEDDFAHHGPTDLLDKLDDSFDLQVQIT
jgi:hypothetical protein